MRPSYGKRNTVGANESYFRIYAVVPLTGSGKKNDPIRPSYVPLRQAGAAYHTGIIAYTQVLTDDGKHAIVEMVATTPTAFAAIRADKRPDVVVFDRAVHSRATMEAGFQRFKKDFTFDKFPRAVAQ